MPSHTLCHSSFAGMFPPSALNLPPIHYAICHLLWCLLSVFRLLDGCHIHKWGLIHWGLHHCNPSQYNLERHMCFPVMVYDPHQRCNKWLFLPLLQVGGSSILLIPLFPSIMIDMVGYTALGAQQRVSQSLKLPSTVGMLSSFPSSTPANDMVSSESVVGVKACDSAMAIEYQVDEFTCTWLAGCFFAHSHTYPGFICTLTHFPLEPGC